MLNVTRRSMLWFLAVAIVVGTTAFQLGRSPADDTSAQASEKQTSNPAAERAAQPPATSYSLTEDENDERIRQALKKTAKFDFEEKALKDVIEAISKQHNIPIWIDEKALTDAVIASDTPITRKVQNVSLESALRLTLRPIQLAFGVNRGVLQITTQTEYDQRLLIRVYPIGDLITPFDKPDARDEADFDSLSDVVTLTIEPNSWDMVGGPGSLRKFGQDMIVAQTPAVHEQLDGLMRSLRKVRIDQRQKLGGEPVAIDGGPGLAAARIALGKPVDWEFHEVPLKDVLEFIAKQSGLEIQLDDRALTDAVIATDTPVTLNLRGIRMNVALRLMLQPLQLTYIIRDEVLLITTPAEADGNMQVRLYPVGDLAPFIPADESDSGHADWDSDALVDSIETTISPNSWDSVGGPGSIGEYPEGLALIVSQSQDVHDQIETLIARLRRRHLADMQNSNAGAGGTKDELIVRVYMLWQRVPKPPKDVDKKSEKQASGSGKQTRRPTEILAQRGVGTHASIGLGGGLTADFNMEEIQPAGVPAEHAERVIRGLVAADSWSQPGREIYAVPNRLIVRQTRAIHREIISLLEKLGPWREEKGGPLGLGGGSIGGGAFCGGPCHSTGSPARVTIDQDGSSPRALACAFQVADPFAPPARKEQSAADPFGPAAGPPAEAQPQKARPGDLRRAAAAEGGQGRNLGAGDAARADRPKRPAHFDTHRVSPSEERIREALGNETDLDFNEVPLRDAVEFIKDKHGIEIQLDERLLTEATVTTDTPITINVKGTSLRSALRLMLSRLPNRPTFVIGDEVLLITTREGAAERKLVRIYNVGELIETRRGPEVDPFGGPPPPSRGGYGAAGPRVPAPADHLIELANVVQQAVEPGTWTPEQGCAVVPLVSKDASLLVVRHSAVAHEEIVELLKSIGDAQGDK